LKVGRLKRNCFSGVTGGTDRPWWHPPGGGWHPTWK